MNNKKVLRFSKILESTINYIDETREKPEYFSTISDKCYFYIDFFIYFEESRHLFIDELRSIASRFRDNEAFLSLIDKYAPNDGRPVLNGNKRKNFYKELFTMFNNDIATIIDNNLEDLQNRFAYNTRNYPQTFLSYSYMDKGLTLILFFYFYMNGGYLYMDWLHSPAYPNGVVIKESLTNALHDSRQLLFLYTPNSEVRTSDRRSLKEWCSWEFGSFYALNNDAKFYIRLPNNLYNYEVPDILDTFQEMYEVYGGKMYGGYRSLFKFYAPKESELEAMAIELLSTYVDARYDTYDVEYQLHNSYVRYDAYNPKSNTAIEFKVLLDNFKNKNDTKYNFGNHDIIETSDFVIPKIEKVLTRMNEQLSHSDVNYELALLLPTRDLSTLSKDDEERIIDELLSRSDARLRKIYFFYVDGIRQISFDRTIRYKTYRYTEKDI